MPLKWVFNNRPVLICLKVTSPRLPLHIPNGHSGTSGFPAGAILDGRQSMTSCVSIISRNCSGKAGSCDNHLHAAPRTPEHQRLRQRVHGTTIDFWVPVLRSAGVGEGGTGMDRVDGGGGGADPDSLRRAHDTSAHGSLELLHDVESRDINN
ncbi:hypothetical protein D4764_03G0001420 [Takifugu flavidus]|uniref:Uncharacterized protein n=1 Tax=Takifugu flavidus TaxID=433684 RepID=A0A5C6N6K3_9TELE|nr:hypothetical protein D4764_03G0001420 [Takifugu flavidus]